MALTELQIKNAKATDKPLKLSDGGGLFLLVQPDRETINEKKKKVIVGAKYWRLAYRFAGKQKTLALGVYPDVSLSDAWEGREAARKVLANGADPSAVMSKKAQKAAVVALAENSFEIVAREWLSKFSTDRKESQSLAPLAFTGWIEAVE